MITNIPVLISSYMDELAFVQWKDVCTPNSNSLKLAMSLKKTKDFNVYSRYRSHIEDYIM
jgi:hypothetical protein